MLLAVDTASVPAAYAHADRRDMVPLAHPMAPRAPRGPQSLPEPGAAWCAPAACGTAQVSPGAPGSPKSRSAVSCGSRVEARAASDVAKTPPRPASGVGGGGHADNPCTGRGPGRPAKPRAGDLGWGG